MKGASVAVALPDLCHFKEANLLALSLIDCFLTIFYFNFRAALLLSALLSHLLGDNLLLILLASLRSFMILLVPTRYILVLYLSRLEIVVRYVSLQDRHKLAAVCHACLLPLMTNGGHDRVGDQRGHVIHNSRQWSNSFHIGSGIWRPHLCLDVLWRSLSVDHYLRYAHHSCRD